MTNVISFRWLRSFVLFVLIPVLGVVPVCANWGSTAGGSVATGNFRSFGTGQVEMRREELLIRLYRDHALVTIDYELHNSGAALDVHAGFPSLGVRLVNGDGEAQDHKEVEDYTIRADGHPVSVTREKGDPTPLKSLYSSKFRRMGEFEEYPEGQRPELLEWFVSTVRFAAGQTRHIHIRYESLYAYCSGGYSDDSDTCDDRFAYVLSTAAAWKGPIVDGRVTIQPVTVDAKPLLLSPKDRFVRTADGFVWQFHNLTPTTADNIVVSLNNHSSSIASYDPDGAAPHNYYEFEGGRYFLLSNDFEASGPSADEDHKPSNVNDESTESGWRTPHAPGSGDAVHLTLKKPAHFNQVGIIPGCGKDKQEWYSHARVKQIEVTENGADGRTATLADDYVSFGWGSDEAYHWVNLPRFSGDAKEIVLTVRATYPGTVDQVTCIEKVMLRQWLPGRPKVMSGIDGHKLP